MLHEITVFDTVYISRILEKVLSHCSSFVDHCRCLIVLWDQRRILFWQRMMRFDNIVLRISSHSIRNRAMAVGSVYNVDVFSMSHAGVKNAVWSSFASLVYNVLDFCVCVGVLDFRFVCMCCFYGVIKDNNNNNNNNRWHI